MKKEKIIDKYFNKINQLSLRNKKYRASVDKLIIWLLENDKVNKDLTTKALQIDKKHMSKARIVSRGDITVAGIEETEILLKKHTALNYKSFHKDRGFVRRGEIILEINGLTSEILVYERTILNIIQRLSGIATETRSLVIKIDKIKNRPFIAATRKTNWGLLDKKAVALGGGLTHRLSLDDGVLIKDNHLLFLQKKFKLNTEREMVASALETSLKNVKNQLIEIEVEKKESIHTLITKFSSIQTNNILGILLDNFSPYYAKKVLNIIKKRYDVSNIIFEASGGISEKNVVEWAKTGVDVISLGALTHSAKAVDISMELI